MEPFVREGRRSPNPVLVRSEYSEGKKSVENIREGFKSGFRRWKDQTSDTRTISSVVETPFDLLPVNPGGTCSRKLKDT